MRTRASGAAVLRRAELKGGTPVAASVNGEGEKEEEHRQEKGVTYVDQKQLRKQHLALERSRIRGSGNEIPSSALKKKRYIDSQEEEDKPRKRSSDESDRRSASSLELESDSQMSSKSRRRQQQHQAPQQQLHFTLSKYDEEEKRELSDVIARLGGVVDDEFRQGVTTRVVVPVPSRSLK